MTEGVSLTVKELIELHGQVLASKMDRVERKVDALQASSDKLDRGEFTDAQVRAIDARIEASVEAQVDGSWRNRERVMGALSFVTATSMLVFTAVVSLHGMIG